MISTNQRLSNLCTPRKCVDLITVLKLEIKVHKVSSYRKSHNQTNTSFELSSQIEFLWKIKDIFKRWKIKVQKFIFQISP